MIRQVRSRLARLAVGSGQSRPGFYVPYPYASSLEGAIPTYDAVETLFSDRRSDLIAMISDFQSTLPDLRSGIEDGKIPWEQQGMFPVLDVVALYHIVRKFHPKRVIEIGSGASSHVICGALSDNRSGELMCIDPAPRRSIEDTGSKIERRMLNTDDASLAQDLAPGDILFIDSSHIMLPGMDVDIQFNRMFPKLQEGVIVHVHDVFLPDGYPDGWQSRYYSEQNALIGWILSGYFEVLYPSFYAATRHEGELRAVLGDLMPSRPDQNAGSIWLRRRT